MKQTKKELILVNVHGKEIITTSVIVADVFGKQHKNVLQKIDALLVRRVEFGRLNFKPMSYLDKHNRDQKFYEMTEEGFLKIALGFTGEKAEDFQEDFIAAFKKMRKLLSDPDRKIAVIEKRKTAIGMTDGLQFIRELLGKETNKHHYSNEHLFCNRALNGEWESINESTLDTYDLRLLEKIRIRNTVLIALHPVQKDRRKMLDNFVSEYRTKNPRLQLVI